jgi:AcrR family transcriptional regulator
MKVKTTKRSPRREYRQVARARRAETTGHRIVSAFEQCFHSQWFDEVTLEEVAQHAGVTVRTVIRRFGGKNGLLAALIETMVPEMSARRTPAAGSAGDLVDRTLAVYEQIGDGVIRNLAQESRVPELKTLIDIGRREHRRITEEAFAEWLQPLKPTTAARVVDALVIATDVYTWKLLRRDMGRSLEETGAVMLGMIQAALTTVRFDSPSPEVR